MRLIKRIVPAGLKGRLVFLVAIGALPALAVTVYTCLEWQRHETLEDQARALQVARHASAIHERVIGESKAMLFSLAQLPAVQRADEAELRELLGAFLQEHPRQISLGLARPDGTIVGSARSPSQATSVADRPFFRRAIETRTFAMGDLEIDSTTGRSTLTVAYPVRDRTGSVRSVLFTSMDLAWVGELAAEARLPEGTAVTVFDGAGIVVAHEPDPQKSAGRSAPEDSVIRAVRAGLREGTIQGASLDGVRRLFGFAQLPGIPGASGLWVSIGIPAAVTTAETERVLARNFALLALAAALAMALAWVGADALVVRQLKRLVNTANRLSRGDLAARTDMPKGSEELRLMARTMDDMAAALQEREHEVLRQHERLAGQERRFRALIENSSDGIVLIDHEAAIRYVAPSNERILGYAAEELIGRDAFDYVHPDDLDLVRTRFASVLAGPGAFVGACFRLLHKDGRWRWIGAVASNLLDEPSVEAIVVNYRDITERREAEESLRRAHDELELRVREQTGELQGANEELRKEIADRVRAEAALTESQALLAGIVESAMDAIIAVDADERVILFNAAAERVFQSCAAEAIGSPVERFIRLPLGQGSPEGLRGLARANPGGNGPTTGRQWTLVGRRAAGREFPLEATVSEGKAAGQPIYTAILRDVSERERVEGVLQVLSGAIEQIGDSVMVTDRAGTIQYTNPSFEKLTGFTQENAIGSNPRILKSGRHSRYFYERLWTTILGGDTFRSIFINRRKDGRLYYEDQIITPIRDGRGAITHFVSTGRDITERQKTQKALRRLNNQLEHEALRIAGVLHDEAGQFLTAAHTTLADVARNLPSPVRGQLKKVRQNLDEVESQLRRLSHELHPRILEDLGLVGAVKFLAEGAAGRTGVAVGVDAGLEQPPPRLVQTCLYRLVQEALSNISKHAGATRVSIELNGGSEGIRCSIKDDGVGFEVAAVLARRGQPGLGLMGILDRLEALGGTFEIVSAPGQGTELRATIPVEA